MDDPTEFMSWLGIDAEFLEFEEVPEAFGLVVDYTDDPALFEE